MSETSASLVRPQSIVVAVVVILLAFLSPGPIPSASAEGTKELTANGGKRALTEFRNSTTAGLYRRTWVRAYAKAGEVLNMGSSAMGVVSGSTSGDIWLWTPNKITDSQVATSSIPTADFKCSTSQSTKGKLTSRAQELAGPLPAGGGYDPCVYTAPESGVYWIAMLGPAGILGTADGTAGTIDAPVTNNTQAAGVSMWDVTVRSSTGVTIPGRVFVDYLAMLSGGNGTTFQQFSTLYAVSSDGFKYRIDLRGLDPNGYILYGNNVGFLDPDGKTPLYHDMVTGDNQLTTAQGGVKQSPATAKIFFATPASDLPTTIVPTPVTPSIDTVTFDGSAGGSAGIFTVGGQFTYRGNVGGIAEVVISRDGANFDPTTSTNRVLRAVTTYGTNVINWDGKDNAGTPFPVTAAGQSYPYKVSMHAGEYHFPLLDAENSANGGPTLTLLNPLGGTCPYTSCSTAFYDDRSYTTTTGVTVNPLTAPSGNNPPPTTFANPATGFNSSTNQRRWGDGSSSGFGNWKGLDLWTYFPGQAVQNALTVVAQQNQDARIQKSHAGSFVIGQNATYTLRVSNVGSGVINGTVTVTDVLPNGLSYVSATGTGWTCGASGQTVTCTHANSGGVAAPGGTLPDITLTVGVTAVAAPAVTNTATVSITSTDENPSNNSASDPTVIDSADLAITKTAGPTTVTTAGQQVTYTITVTNNGPSAATGVSVTEAIPAGMTYSSFTASQGTYTTASNTWSVGGMPAGSSATLNIVATVNSITCGAQISNTASRAAGSPTDYNSTNDSASATITQGGTISLSGVIKETGTGVPIVGATVTLTDSLNRTYSATSGANGAYSFTSTQANPIALGNASVTVSKGGYATNGPQTKNISNCGANTLDVNLDTTNLLVTKDDGRTSANPDDVLIYAIKVTNTGTIEAANVQIVDSYPAALLNFQADTSGLTPVIATVGELTTRTYTLANALGPGESFEFTLQFQVKKPLPSGTTVVSNKVTASTTSPEADLTNNEKQDDDGVAQAPDLYVSKADARVQVQPGQTGATYTISYGNRGNASSTGVTLTDTLPAGVTFVSCSDGCTQNGQTVQWGLGTISAGATGSVTLAYTVNSTASVGAVLVNSATIGGSETDADQSNNTAFDSNLVGGPQIVLEKTVSSANTPPAWGEEVTYTLTWRNVSLYPAYNVVVSDPLPEGATFVRTTGDAPCTFSGLTVTCNLPPLGPLLSGSVQIVVTYAPVTGGTAGQPGYTVESAAGSTVVTSSTASPALTAKWTDASAVISDGWNRNPRLGDFTVEGWAQPGAGFGEFHWTDAGRINAQWVATTQAGLGYGNYTFYRQKFCVPLNATALAGTLEVANDDYGDQYVNGAGFGTKIGAGEIQTYDIANGLQAGGNLYAVRLLNNSHGGHSMYDFKDHVGLAFRINAAWNGTAPFAKGPGLLNAGGNAAFTLDAGQLSGVAPLKYRIDYGDGSPATDWGSTTSFSHLYATAGSYTAVVSARDAYGCTATDTVPVTVLPAGRNIGGNTASVTYQNAYNVSITSTTGASLQLPSSSDLAIAKTLNTNPVYAGEPLQWTLVVTNNGVHSVGQVSLVDSLPAGILSPSFSPSAGSYDAGTQVWTGQLMPGASFDVGVSGIVDPAETGTLDNTATVSPIGGSDSVSGNNTATAGAPINRRADLGVAVSVDKAQYTAGESLTYTIVVTNYGSSSLTGFTLNPSVPGLTNVTYTPSSGSSDPATGAWTGVTFGSVESLTLTVTGTVPPGTTADLTLSATVGPPSGVTDGVSNNNAGSATSKLNPLAVDLVVFSAELTPEGVRLAWETVSEAGLAGFNLYRSAGDGAAVRINEALIPPVAPGSSEGYSYTWVDRTAEQGTAYAYLLEDVATGGAATQHGPVTVPAVKNEPNAIGLVGFDGRTAMDLIQSALIVAILVVGALVALKDGRKAE